MRTRLRTLERRTRWIRVALPIGVLATAAILAIVGPTAAGAEIATLVSVLAFDPGSLDPIDAVTVGGTLGLIAVGLVRRKRLVRRLAVATFAAAAVAQLATLHHPLGAAIAVACLVSLMGSRRRYRAESDRRVRRFAAAAALLGVAVLVIGSLASDAVAAAPAGGPLDAVISSIVSGLGDLDPTGVLVPNRAEQNFEALELLARLAVLAAVFGILRADPETPAPDLLEQYREVARRNARGALAPFQLGRDKLLFALPGGDGVVAYGRTGRHAIVLGDPIGKPDDAWRTFQSFLDRCARSDVAVGVYQAGAAASERLRGLGFRTFKIGEEAIIQLDGFSLAGSRRANLRHTVSRSRRGGIEVLWRPEGLAETELARFTPAIRDIDEAWRRDHGPRMGFTISEFDPAELGSVGIAVAVEPNGEPAAFATFRRTDPGGWVLDLLRRRAGGTPGAIEACVATAALAMAAAGDRRLSLGLVALKGLSTKSGAPEARLLAIAARIVRPAYDIAGLAFFKDKFDPRWEPRYAAVQGRLGAPGFVVALVRLHLAAPPRLPRREGRPPFLPPRTSPV